MDLEIPDLKDHRERKDHQEQTDWTALQVSGVLPVIWEVRVPLDEMAPWVSRDIKALMVIRVIQGHRDQTECKDLLARPALQDLLVSLACRRSLATCQLETSRRAQLGISDCIQAVERKNRAGKLSQRMF